MSIETVAVIGSGLMGRGIAYAAALGGFRTLLHDVSAERPRAARCGQIRKDLDEGVARGKVTSDAAAAAHGRLLSSTSRSTTPPARTS